MSGERDGSPALRTEVPRAGVTVSRAEIFNAVFEAISAHCKSISGFGATLSEFEAKLIAGDVRMRLCRVRRRGPAKQKSVA
jgi:hypothetical protein